MRFLSSVLTYLIMVVMLVGPFFGVSTADAATKSKPAASKKSESAATGDVAKAKSDWQVGMIKDEKGDFNYCLMRAEFNNDLSLAFALSPKQEINIGIGVPNAGFAKDEKHPMKVTIDGGYSKDVVAIAANPQLLLLPMRDDKELWAALRSGKTIALIGKEDATKFALKNTSKALQGLQTCVDVGTGKVKMPPQASGKDSGKTAANGKKPIQGDFPPPLKALLQKAGLKDLELVTIPDIGKSPVDFGWKTAGLFGGMRERQVPPDKTLESMTDIMEAGYKKQCTGTFAINKGAVEKYSGIDMRTMNVACDMKDHKAYVALLIYLTDNHLFTMFMHEGDNNNKEAANKARDSVTVLIRDLAKEQPAAKPQEKSAVEPAPQPAPAAAKEEPAKDQAPNP